jgi:hypothetical protein
MQDHYWKTTFGALEYDPEVFLPFGETWQGEGTEYSADGA